MSLARSLSLSLSVYRGHIRGYHFTDVVPLDVLQKFSKVSALVHVLYEATN